MARNAVHGAPSKRIRVQKLAVELENIEPGRVS
jgi:hypothetical protein